MAQKKTRLRLKIVPQPDDTTCGPTCLHAVYGYYDDHHPLQKVIAEIPPLETGGTLAVFLACHALSHGYKAMIYTYNLQVFDPTWFENGGTDLAAKLEAQTAAKHNAKTRLATQSYLQFLKLGGIMRFEELRPGLIRRFLARGIPILTGLSATYLYNCARETPDNKYDSIRGEPAGHFVVLSGYDRKRREVLVADPYRDNPRLRGHYYTIGIERVIGAILLGILTYDANLLIIEPGTRREAH